MKTPAPRPACPRADLHTPVPPGRQVEEWVREMNRTHLQLRCPGCGLYACWTPRVLLPQLACALCPRTDGIDWTELHAGLGGEPSARLVPLCPDHWSDGEPLPSTILLPYRVEELPSVFADVHRYLSTACHHGEHTSCRNQCKFCTGCCICPCHETAGTQPTAGSQVDQARGIARELLAALRDHAVDLGELEERIRRDPGLFWLQGEAPPGRWKETP